MPLVKQFWLQVQRTGSTINHITCAAIDSLLLADFFRQLWLLLR